MREPPAAHAKLLVDTRGHTSFNENQAVVCKPEEALDCLLRTRMDVLVMGKSFIKRTQVA